MFEFYFIADGNKAIGLGHVKRALLIANALNARGVYNIVFFDIKNSKIANQLILENNFKVKKIKIDETFAHIFSFFKNKSSAFLTIDSDLEIYRTSDFQKKLRKLGLKSMYITVDNNGFFDSDLLLNQNVIAKTLKYNTSLRTKLLLGTEYFIVSDELKFINPIKKRDTRSLLITLGNADPNGITLQILKNIEIIAGFFDKIIIIVGGLNNDYEKINERVKLLNNPKYSIVYNQNNILKYMQKINFAITSLGLGYWELIMHDVVCLTIASSKREIPTQLYLNQHKISYSLGNVFEEKNTWLDKIVFYFDQNLLGDFSSSKLRKAINPFGVELVVDEILKITKNSI